MLLSTQVHAHCSLQQIVGYRVFNMYKDTALMVVRFINNNGRDEMLRKGLSIYKRKNENGLARILLSWHYAS
jgi:hypothetical protein